ncbi:MAG: SDR family oxidoreductase [Caldilineaceae bacterium]
MRVNAICPGTVETPMADQAAAIIPDIRTRAQATPLGRLGNASEIANAVIWLVPIRHRLSPGLPCR